MGDQELDELEAGKVGAKGEDWMPVKVEYKGVHFRIQKRDGPDVHILKDVSGVCHPGRLLSIMGPSGAGKTTLLDVLAGNIYVGKVEGEILVNGSVIQPKMMQQISCYVMQNPVLLSSATVRESLLTSALLRIPLEVSRAEKEKLVDHIIDELDLGECQDVLIGNEVEGIKGISGGQKRRLAVGLELVTQPSVVLLDEPTSGLDSEIALTIVRTLKELATKGRTVVCTIHQPNSDIVENFDDFALMANGQNMYYGNWGGAVDFFSNAGYPCPTYKNPTDYFMSVAKNKEAVSVLVKTFASNREQIQNGPSNGESAIVPMEPYKFRQKQAGVPGWYQTAILWKRFLLTWKRHPILFGAEFTQYAFIGVFIGLMYLQVSDDLQGGPFARYASQFFALVAVVFTPAFSAATLWDNERLVIKMETSRNAYQLGPYFLAKTLTSWPMEIAFTFIFGLIVYTMVGYQASVAKFFIFWVILVLFQLISESIGLLAAVSTPKAAYAVLLLSLVFLPLLSFTGFMVRDIPVYFKWINKIAYITFATAALAKEEFSGLTFKYSDGRTISGDRLFSSEVIENDELAESIRQTVQVLDNGLSVGMNILVLACMLTVVRIMTYISLKLTAKFRML